MVVVALGVAGCGDALLPAGYVPPPETAVGGQVVNLDGFEEAVRPQLSLEWLAMGDSGTDAALVGQPLWFQRSAQLRKDWDIGLDAPEKRALNVAVGTPGFRLAIGKVIYYDDRVVDGRLDWACDGTCDRVNAVSVEFVVFAEMPLFCQRARDGVLENRERLGAGFHYYQFEGGAIREVARNADLTFRAVDGGLTGQDLAGQLNSFAKQLQRRFSLDAVDGC
jgi:hypothetical protein